MHHPVVHRMSGEQQVQVRFGESPAQAVCSLMCCWVPMAGSAFNSTASTSTTYMVQELPVGVTGVTMNE